MERNLWEIETRDDSGRHVLIGGFQIRRYHGVTLINVYENTGLSHEPRNRAGGREADRRVMNGEWFLQNDGGFDPFSRSCSFLRD